MINEATMKADLPETIKFIDPALYTYDEYKIIVGHKYDEYGEEEYHHDGAYETTVSKLNEFDTYKSYTRLMANITKKGMPFTVKAKIIDYMTSEWVKYDDKGYPVEIDGKYQQLTAEERKLALTGKNRYCYYFAIFNADNECVAATQDEWGALLVSVAEEYRGFGFGPYLVGLQRKYFPKANSGGFTVPGLDNLWKVHTQFVKDYLTSGKYSKLVRDNKLTVDKVREITKHVRTIPTKSPIAFNEEKMYTGKIELFHEDDSSEWVVYDQAIAKLFNKQDKHHTLRYWTDKAIIACHYNDITETVNNGTYSAVKFGKYNNEKAKIQLVKIACSFDILNNDISKFRIENTDLPSVANLFDTPEVLDSKSVLVEFKKEHIIPLNVINNMVKKEKAFRKSFDKYEEFKTQMWELGASFIQ